MSAKNSQEKRLRINDSITSVFRKASKVGTRTICVVLAEALARCKGRGAGIEPAGTKEWHDLEVAVGTQR